MLPSTGDILVMSPVLKSGVGWVRGLLALWWEGGGVGFCGWFSGFLFVLRSEERRVGKAGRL